ncbi:MAG: GNAT family N-acetyltransferase [Gemmatimonadaceae bacterium]
MTSTRDIPTTRAALLGAAERITPDDIDELNRVFSTAFTERYRRDGMVGVRVPSLNPAIWRYAIEDAGEGAMLWRDERDEIVAFNVVHRSGVEGWMGPLAVRPDWQGSDVGKEIVRAGTRWLGVHPLRVIGLETMPRTMDNIGFYSRLGFVPGHLTITLTVEADGAHLTPPRLLGSLASAAREDAIAAARALLHSQLAGYDFSREMRLSAELGVGDTMLLEAGSRVVGFAVFHTAPLVDGRAREEIRVLKLVLDDEGRTDAIVRGLVDVARGVGARRVAIRVQGDYVAAYRRLISLGARVRWTDLRMYVAGYEEVRSATGVVLSNWEI